MIDNLPNTHQIKTIGDAYFCVSGLHAKSSDHPERLIRFTIDVFGFLNGYNKGKTKQIMIRAGIHNGPCVAGVIGTKKFAYDLWGDVSMEWTVCFNMFQRRLIQPPEWNPQAFLVDCKSQEQPMNECMTCLNLKRGKASRSKVRAS